MRVRVGLTAGVLVLAIVLALGLSAAATASETLLVDHDALCGTPGRPYCTIQAAVDAASPGDTIRVDVGTYDELVHVNKQLTLIGAKHGVDGADPSRGTGETVVDGTSGSTSFYVTASDVTIDGFTVQGATNPNVFGAGVVLAGGTHGTHLVNTILQDNLAGLDLANDSAVDQTVIQHDLFKDNNEPGPAGGTGIYADQFSAGGTLQNVLVDANHFQGNADSAIDFSSTDATKPATAITISNNVFDGNGRALVAFNLTSSSVVGNDLLDATGSATADLRLFEGVSGLAITGNRLANGAGRALRISDSGTGAPIATGVTFNLDSITGYSSAQPAVAADDYNGTLDASADYWGSSDPTAVAAEISGTVDFTPLLDHPDGDTGTVGFQPDLSSLTVHSLGAQSGTGGRIQEGVGRVASGGTVHVAAGTYHEDVAVGKTLTLSGAGLSTTTVSGPAGGDTATIHVTASGVVVSGFTVTRDGDNTADWNDPTLNTAGLAVQGQSASVSVSDSKFTGNRTGIDVNNSNGNSITNNLIQDNRTGLVFRNQTDHTTVENNSITGNWTLGVLFLDGSGGTNSPPQSAASSTFSGNDISGNWYGQVVDRQAGGSLPAPGTNVKNFSGNWYGTNAPSRTTTDSSEPGYASQIPTEFGGTATPPATAPPQLEGPASANIDYTPFLWTGTDTSADVGFQGDLSQLGVTADGAQSGTKGRIQEGVDDVTGGGTAHVLAGTYAESVSIAKTLTLDGAGDTTVIHPPTGQAIAISGTGQTLSHLKTTGATGSGNAGSGIAIVGATTNLTIAHVTSTANGGNGIAIDTTGAISGLTLDTVDLSSNTGDGLRFPTSLASLSGLTIESSHLDGNGFAGMEIYGPPSTGAFDNVSITDTTFSHDATKGIYAERLSNATLDGVTVDGSGTSGSASAGIDLNLKKQSFSNITIKNSTVESSGTGDTTNGAGITIKSRDDGTNGPTSVDGVTLSNDTITGNQVGIRFGEPAKNNVGPTTVKVSTSTIAGNIAGGFVNLTQTRDDATCNWWGSATGPTNAGNPGGTGDSVSGDVSFTPWETSAGGACNGGLAPAGFAAGGSFSTYGTSDSQQVTVPSVANRVLVFVFAGKVGGDVLSSVTYAGRPLQQLARQDERTVHLELRYLVNPPVGTAALAWSKTGASQNITWGYSVYSGADQTTPFGAPAATGGIADTAGAKSVSVSTASGDTVVDGVVFNDSTVASGPTAGSGQNQRWSRRISTTQGGSSDKASPTGGAVTTSWTPAAGSTSSLDWALIAAPLHAAGSGGGGGPQPSTTTTVASTTSTNVLPGTAVSDTATVSGSGPTPTGTVTFFLCQPGTVTANGGDCHTGGAQVGAAAPVAGGHATSESTNATTTPGTYCWRAEYSGDANYTASQDGAAANECFAVTSPGGGGPIAFQAAHGYAIYGTSDSQQVTVPSGLDRALVFVFAGKLGGETLSSVTYGGQPLQLLRTADAGSVHLELRGLLDPPVGTAALAWSKTGANQNITWGYSLYTGVGSFGTPASTGGTNDSAGMKSLTLAAATGDLVVDGVVFNMGAVSAGPAAAGGQSQRWSTRISTTQGGSSDKPGAASVTMSWTPAAGSTVGDWALAAVPLHPTGGGGGPLPSSTQTSASTTAANVSPGTSVTDTATVSGAGPTPTGTVTFFLCQPATVSANGGDCHVGGSQVGVAKTLDATGNATSDATSNTTAVGTYCWRAEYGGDSSYTGSTDGSAAGECFTTASPAGGGPIGFEAARSFTTYGTSDSQQVAVPNASGRVLVFEFAGKVGGDTLSSVTYGGQPLQLLASRDAASVHLELRYLVNPPVGTAALAWTKTGSNQNITWGYSIYSGVNQTTPFGTPSSAGASGDAPTPKSLTLSAPTGTAVVDAVVFNDGTVGGGPTAGGGQNQRWSTRISTTQGGSSDKPGAGSTTVTWTPANGSGTVDWALIAAALQPGP